MGVCVREVKKFQEFLLKLKEREEKARNFYHPLNRVVWYPIRIA